MDYCGLPFWKRALPIAVMFGIGVTYGLAASAPESKPPQYGDGSYSGTARGYNGTMTVQVTVSGGRISGVKVTKTRDDPPYYRPAEKRIEAAIIEKQSTEVDTVTGATLSSRGIINGAANALAKAKKTE